MKEQREDPAMMSLAHTNRTTLGVVRGGRPFSRMIGGLVASLSRRTPEPPPAPLPSGPATAAIVDADYERLASFGSWESLREDLRTRAAEPRRRSA
jgi:hypothetical protein